MTVVITGVGGFIGSTLAERIVASGEPVIGIDSFTDYYSPELKRANISALQNAEGFTLREIPLETAGADDFEDARVIFHLAGQPGVRRSWGREFDAYTSANVQATQNLLEVARTLPALSRIVYSSSSSVYGNAETFPTVETALPAPISPYGVTKLAAEHLCGVYAANFGLAITSLRYFTVFGPRQRPDMAFTRFLTAARDDTPIEVYGTGEQIRDFTFVDDVVEANLAAARSEITDHRVYNVAGGTSVSVNEVLATIEGITSRRLKVARLDRAQGDVARTGGDTARITADLEWTPRVGLEEGLTRHWEWVTA